MFLYLRLFRFIMIGLLFLGGRKYPKFVPGKKTIQYKLTYNISGPKDLVIAEILKCNSCFFFSME